MNSDVTNWWARPCPSCDGAGERIFNNHNGDPAHDEAEDCPACEGTGSVLCEGTDHD